MEKSRIIAGIGRLANSHAVYAAAPGTIVCALQNYTAMNSDSLRLASIFIGWPTILAAAAGIPFLKSSSSRASALIAGTAAMLTTSNAAYLVVTQTPADVLAVSNMAASTALGFAAVWSAATMNVFGKDTRIKDLRHTPDTFDAYNRTKLVIQGGALAGAFMFVNAAASAFGITSDQQKLPVRADVAPMEMTTAPALKV